MAKRRPKAAAPEVPPARPRVTYRYVPEDPESERRRWDEVLQILFKAGRRRAPRRTISPKGGRDVSA